MSSFGAMGPGHVLPLKVLIFVTDRLGLLFYHYGKDPYREIPFFYYLSLVLVCLLLFSSQVSLKSRETSVVAGREQWKHESWRDQSLLCWTTEVLSKDLGEGELR